MASIHHILRRCNVAEKIPREGEEGAWQLQRDDDDGLGIGVVMGLNRDTHRNRRRRELEDPSLVSDARTMDRVSTSSLSHIYGKKGRS